MQSIAVKTVKRRIGKYTASTVSPAHASHAIELLDSEVSLSLYLCLSLSLSVSLCLGDCVCVRTYAREFVQSDGNECSQEIP